MAARGDARLYVCGSLLLGRVNKKLYSMHDDLDEHEKTMIRIVNDAVKNTGTCKDFFLAHYSQLPF